MSEQSDSSEVAAPKSSETPGASGAVGFDERRHDVLASTLHELRSRGPDLVFRMALVAFFLVLVWPLLMPIVLGGLGAIVLTPLHERVHRRLGRMRVLAPGIVTGVAVLGFLLPMTWVAWSSLKALEHFVGTTLGTSFGATREHLIGMLADVFGTGSGEESFAAALDDALRRFASSVTVWLGGLARGLPEGITNLFLFVLALYFGLRDGRRLVDWAHHVSPVSRRRTVQLFGAVRTSVHGTLLGMLVVAGVQGGLSLLALVACRVENALLWGFIAAILSVLPIVGTTPVTIGSAMWLYLQGRPLAAIGMVAAALVIGVSDNVVRPWVQSTHDDMHPLLALLAIFGGLAVFGPSGLIIGPVVASMAVWAVETYRDEPPGQPPSAC